MLKGLFLHTTEIRTFVNEQKSFTTIYVGETIYSTVLENVNYTEAVRVSFGGRESYDYTKPIGAVKTL